MSITQGLLPTYLIVTANTLLLLLLSYAALRINWRKMQKYPQTINIFFASCLILTLISFLRIGVLAGLELHLLGTVAATLMMGWPLALIAMTLVHIMIMILQKSYPYSLGINVLIYSALPILSCHLLDRFIIKKMPRNPFIFVLGGAFIGGALSISVAACAGSALYYLLDIYTWEQIWKKYLMFLPLFAYPEGFINGTFISSMVAFFPRWLSYFDEKSYFGFNT